ncbi:uncharacterized protein Dwil_GK21717 [Drosophila willistoni]|uniref:GK21717 n=1 Tax=Drosophila willistoni TaxID=7260 RepID=B4MPK5_DROWI|nr:uncharacterized protein LOC6639969 [Drosophila willistoni]EDW74044.1 uncharacterized protein Dwil_GK21717 [Drosophila willistoni]
MVRLDSQGSLICAGIVSILVVIAYNCVNSTFFYNVYDLGTHISILQTLSSIFLIVGAIKRKYKLYVPWMITTVFFIYSLVLLAFDNIRDLPDFGAFVIIILSFVLNGYFCFALYGAQNAFDQERKAEPPSYNSLHDKSNFTNHI